MGKLSIWVEMNVVIPIVESISYLTRYVPGYRIRVFSRKKRVEYLMYLYIELINALRKLRDSIPRH